MLSDRAPLIAQRKVDSLALARARRPRQNLPPMAQDTPQPADDRASEASTSPRLDRQAPGEPRHARFLEGSAAPPSRREVWLALLLGLVIALLPTSAAVLRPDRVFFAVDTATSQLPWSATPAAEGLRVANPALSDQGICFYPFYAWVSASWRGGDPPLWCPLVYAGAPGFGNAQAGALDPQVLALVGLEALGGEPLFHYGFAWAGWLRIAFAFLGAYLLARRLGLVAAGAALCGVTFAFSGYLLLWLNHPLGHVPPLFPWVLYFLEGLRPRPDAPREPEGSHAGTMAKVALAMALAILGGHAETAFYVGVAAGCWALALAREDLQSGLRGLFALALGTGAAAASLLPLSEYLGLSAARAVRAVEAAETTAHLDLVSLGVLLLASGWILVARGRLLEPRAQALAPGSGAPRTKWLPVVAASLFTLTAVVVLARRGLSTSAALTLVPDLLGAPAEGGYRGEGNYIERASPWIAFLALGLALANAFSARSSLRRRGLVGIVGLLAFLLSIELSGLVELYRFVPLVGLGDTVRFAAVGSLGLGLLAGDALQSATRSARVAAALVLAPLCIAVWLPPGPAPLAPEVATAAEQNELCGFVLTPARELAGEDSRLEGWWSPELDFARARARVERIDVDGNVLERSPLNVALEVFDAPSAYASKHAADAVAAAPPGARWFRTPFLVTRLLPDGHWRVRVEFLREGANLPAADRLAGVSTIHRRPDRRPASVAAIVTGLAALVLLPAAPAPLAWLAVLLALCQGAWFARDLNPLVPRSQVFPPTRTEALLAEGLGAGRFFSDVGVLPPDTGLVRGLRAIEGYDAMDPVSFNQYRQFALPPGVNPLLAWNPRGVDLSHPVFRLFGVTMLALRDPLEDPDWQLVASPADDPPCETWVYAARDPMPRAFCVPEVVSLDELGELVRTDVWSWDPLRVASSDGAWRPETPFTNASVSDPRITNNRVALDVALDGDGFLVITEQSFPGWKAYVDGEETELATANMVFRGVPLSAGQHTIELRYRPKSIVFGALLSLASLGGILALSVLGWRSRLGRRSQGAARW